MIKDYLKSNILLTDGAMGTYFIQLTGDTSSFCELANLKKPDVIEKIHNEYIEAGSKLIRTNTFSANSYALELPRDKVKEIIQNGFLIGQKAAKGKDVFVGASIGPIRETGEEERSDILDEYKFIVDSLCEVGANIFIFETFSTPEYLCEISEYIKSKNKDAFILTQFAFTADGLTRDGMGVKGVFDEIEKCKWIDAHGFNCGSSPSHLLKIVSKLDFGKQIISVLPNASYPEIVNERTVYVNNPDYFAHIMSEISTLGTKIIGGCCGTTPAHIKAISGILNLGEIVDSSIHVDFKSKAPENKLVENKFIKKLEKGEFVIAVELDPPFDTNISSTIENAKVCASYGIDLITVADSPRGIARVDSLMIAAKIRREAGIEAMPHLCCRDKNVNALRSGLLATHIENIRNVLAVTGDPILEADKVTTKSVFNLNSFKLMELISLMNDETFKGDKMTICGALNLNVSNKDVEFARMLKKADRGSSLFFTQPLFDDDSIEALKTIKEKYGFKVMAGIMPLVTYKNALFLNNEVPGITIPQKYVDRFEHKMDRLDAENIGINIAVEIAEKVRPYVSGFYMITPFERIHVVTSILDRLKSKGIY